MKRKEIIMYLIMGVATTIVSWASYSVFVMTLPIDHAKGKVLLANILSWILAVLFAYVTNKVWVFESRSWKPSYVVKEFIRFVSARLFTGVLEVVGVPLLMACGLDQSILGIEGMLSKIIVSVVVVILNYVLSKLLIFQTKN